MTDFTASSLAAALMGGALPPPQQAPAGPAPLSTMPAQFSLAPDAVQMQRGHPSMPWYAVPGIFGNAPLGGAPPQGLAAAAPLAAPAAQMPQQPSPDAFNPWNQGGA